MFTSSGSSSFVEAHVVVRAAEPALLAELKKRDAAHRARPLVEPRQLLGRLADGQVLANSPAIVGSTSDASSDGGARNLCAHSSHRCSSFGLPSTRSVM